MKNTPFCRRLTAGDAIRPFMVSGVLEREYTGELNGGKMNAFREDAFAEGFERYGATRFKEFDAFEFFGMKGKWRLCDTEAPRYADGKYYFVDKLAVMPIYLEIESETEQEIAVKTDERRIMVILNGEIVYNNKDSASRNPRERIVKRSYVFEHNVNPNCEIMVMRLKKGTNTFFALTGHVAKRTGIQFDMTLLEAESSVYARVPLNMDESVRTDIYESYQRTHMIDDFYYENDVPCFKVGNYPLKSCKVKCHASGPKGIKFEDLTIGEGGICEIPEAMKAGGYAVYLTWYLDDGTVLCEKRITFTYYELTDAMPGYENLGARRKVALEYLAGTGNPLALYRLGRASEISYDKIDEWCRKIDKKEDCADFFLLPLLWLMWEDRGARKIAPEIKERVKGAALGFRYWVDEPNTASMFYCSENHRIGFHVCEYLAGLLFPKDVFTNCEEKGNFHLLKGRMHLVEWLSQRCKMGFDEPHSAQYIPVTLSALLCLREVLPMEEYPLRNMVNILLDFITFIFASGNFEGCLATPRGRAYNHQLRCKYRSSMTSVFWLLFGDSKANITNMNQELAFSPYVPPKGICNLAYDKTPTDFSFKEGLMHFDKQNADFLIRRTADYMMGAVRDHNVGACDMHFVSAMISMRGDCPIFFSAPNNTAEGSGLRPDYWAGQAFMPRVIMSGRTMAVIYHNVGNPVIWITHCHFNRRKFDEALQKGGFTFGRKGDGYTAIYSSTPHAFREEGLYAGRELVSEGNETVWMAICGSKAEDGTFEEFIDKCLASKLSISGENAVFSSPISGVWEFGLTNGFKVDGADVPVPEYLAFSPYLKSRYGSGRFDYDCFGYKNTLWAYSGNA